MSLFDQIEICRHALTEIERAAGETEQVESQVNAQVNRFLDLIQPDIVRTESLTLHEGDSRLRIIEAFRQLRPKEAQNG